MKEDEEGEEEGEEEEGHEKCTGDEVAEFSKARKARKERKSKRRKATSKRTNAHLRKRMCSAASPPQVPANK
jgi:hypothetical protein